jgi:predicted transcriptional regulator
MEVRLTPEQQAHLAELTARDGRGVDEIAQEAIARYLENETRFAEVVRLGIEAADRGDFIASEEVSAGVERVLPS